MDTFVYLNNSNMRLLLITTMSLVLSSFTINHSAKVKIKIFVVDEASLIIEGAKVTLYGTFENYKKEEKPLFSGTTNAKGFVEFKELKEMNYYLHVTKGDLNNNGGSVETEELHAKGKNRFEIMIN
jgi:hypothetical protein